MNDATELITRIEASIGDTMQTHDRVALMYSGGLESSLLLKLVEPWRHKTRVYTVRTDAIFPHMVEFIDRKLKDWDHRVITTDLAASFREMGIPAAVVPIEHMQGMPTMIRVPERLPRIVPWPLCCYRNRNEPGYDAVRRDGITAFIHGQRASDFSRDNPAPLAAESLTAYAPLWEASRADVSSAVEALGVELPSQYAEGRCPGSMDCSICPAELSPKRRAYMATNYPQHLHVADKLNERVVSITLAALEADRNDEGVQVS